MKASSIISWAVAGKNCLRAILFSLLVFTIPAASEAPPKLSDLDERAFDTILDQKAGTRPSDVGERVRMLWFVKQYEAGKHWSNSPQLLAEPSSGNSTSVAESQARSKAVENYKTWKANPNQARIDLNKELDQYQKSAAGANDPRDISEFSKQFFETYDRAAGVFGDALGSIKLRGADKDSGGEIGTGNVLQFGGWLVRKGLEAEMGPQNQVDKQDALARIADLRSTVNKELWKALNANPELRDSVFNPYLKSRYGVEAGVSAAVNFARNPDVAEAEALAKKIDQLAQESRGNRASL